MPSYMYRRTQYISYSCLCMYTHTHTHTQHTHTHTQTHTHTHIHCTRANKQYIRILYIIIYFHMLLELASGKTDLPYENIQNLGYHVIGMPPGIPLLNPLLYSEQQLHQILANLDKIVFLRVPQTTRVSPTTITTRTLFFTQYRTRHSCTEMICC